MKLQEMGVEDEVTGISQHFDKTTNCSILEMDENREIINLVSH